MSDMIVAKEFKHANRTVKVYIDPEPLNPRKEWDNGTIMVHWHRDYDLGDDRIEPATADELKELYAEKGYKILHIMPLYLLDHSGLSISVQGFSCPWDSGQVGWCFITESKVMEMGYTDTSPENLEKIIRAEVSTYDQFLRGDVYGYVVYGQEDNDLESCWGFYDEEDVTNEAKGAAERSTDPYVEMEAEALAGRITYAGVA